MADSHRIFKYLILIIIKSFLSVLPLVVFLTKWDAQLFHSVAQRIGVTLRTSPAPPGPWIFPPVSLITRWIWRLTSASTTYHPVTAVYGSGGEQLAAVFADLDTPAAKIGGTDIAMRSFLPRDTLALTVTKPMFEQLCQLDEKCFLHKSFWNNVKQARLQPGNVS